MAALLKHSGVLTASGWSDAFGASDLDSLANGSSVISTATILDNSSDLNLFLWLSFRLGAISPSSGGYLEFYLLPELDDGSTVADGDSTATAADQPTATYRVATAILRAKASSTQNGRVGPIEVPPGKYKIGVINRSGVALAASSNNFKYKTTTLNLNG